MANDCNPCLPESIIQWWCRRVILALMAIGMALTVAHSDSVGAPVPDASFASYALLELSPQPGGSAIAAAAQPAPCPAQSSCHSQPFFSAEADPIREPAQGTARRLIPGPALAAGRQVGLDHPPPIA